MSKSFFCFLSQIFEELDISGDGVVDLDNANEVCDFVQCLLCFVFPLRSIQYRPYQNITEMDGVSFQLM